MTTLITRDQMRPGQLKVLVECFACGHTETGYSHHHTRQETRP